MICGLSALSAFTVLSAVPMVSPSITGPLALPSVVKMLGFLGFPTWNSSKQSPKQQKVAMDD